MGMCYGFISACLMCRLVYVLCAVFSLWCVRDLVCDMCGILSVLCTGLVCVVCRLQPRPSSLRSEQASLRSIGKGPTSAQEKGLTTGCFIWRGNDTGIIPPLNERLNQCVHSVTVFDLAALPIIEAYVARLILV